MAAINFPDTPTLNQEYTHPDTGTTYIWNGTQWRIAGTNVNRVKWVEYPSRNLVEVPPEYTLIGYISMAVDETTPGMVSMNIKGDLSTTAVYNNNFGGEDFTLIVDRMAGVGRIIINAGNVSNSPFYIYTDNANNRYIIFMQNNANRNSFSVSTMDGEYITLDNLQIDYTLPDLLSACQLIDQNRTIYEMDIVELISNLNTTLNSISGFFEDQVRPIISEGAV